MPTFEDTSFVHSMLDEWNADFKSSSDQRVYPDAAEDPMLSFSQYTHANSELVRDEPGSLCARVPKPAQVPFREGISRASTAVSCSTACNCQQKILSKLSELSVSGRGNQYVPFDKCLSENKEIVTLCTSTVNCTNKCHDDDIVLMFTNVALISHVILIYDRPLRNHSQEGDDDSSTFDLAPSDKASPELTRSGSSNSSRELLPYQRQDNCVRLSLGSYQLDQKDEQILRANLLKIELSKIGSLIDSFEKRFCAFDCIWGIGAQQEPKPLGEVITYLKKRLRVNFEALANLAQAM
ncbi:hypothetical protein MMC21_005275 [Puttea exsequens]|nr:hypothetical protein [Puttea exsequens]